MVESQGNSETGSVPIEVVESTKAQLVEAEQANEKTSLEKQELEHTASKLREDIAEMDKRIAKRDEMWNTRVTALQQTVEDGRSTRAHERGMFERKIQGWRINWKTKQFDKCRKKNEMAKKKI